MSWIWRYEAADGAALQPSSDGSAPPESPAHASQSDAESWLGEMYGELAAAGVAQVTLLDGDRVVYGPMSLDPA